MDHEAAALEVAGLQAWRNHGAVDAAIGGNFQAGQVALVALADGVAQLRPQVMSVAGRIPVLRPRRRA